MWKVRERDVELEGEIREGKDVEGIGKGCGRYWKGMWNEGRNWEGKGKGCGS